MQLAPIRLAVAPRPVPLVGTVAAVVATRRRQHLGRVQCERHRVRAVLGRWTVAIQVRSYCGHLLQLGGRAARVHVHMRMLAGRIIGYVPVAVARMHVAQLLGATPQVPRRQDALERLAELGVEDRIDDRIERRVRVAQPRQDLECLAADARLAEGGHNVDAEERHPADEEHAHDDADRDGRLVVGHMVRRRVVQVAHLELLGRARPPNAAVAVLLLLGQFAGPRDGAYGLDVLLGVAVESARDGRYLYCNFFAVLNGIGLVSRPYLKLYLKEAEEICVSQYRSCLHIIYNIS